MQQFRINYGGRFEVFFVDVRRNWEVAGKFGIYAYRLRSS